jgi:hypothetical protein
MIPITLKKFTCTHVFFFCAKHSILLLKGESGFLVWDLLKATQMRLVQKDLTLSF